MTTVYQVCVLHTSRDFFDYEAQDLKPCIGARVWVPFGKQTRLGIVINNDLAQNEDMVLKPISALIDDEALISEPLLQLCVWIGRYYQSPLSEVLPLALPKKYRLGQACQLPMGDFYQLTMSLEEAKNRIPARARKQHELVDYLAQEAQAVSKQALSVQGFNSSHLLTLVNSDIIALSQQILIPPVATTTRSNPLELHPEQAQAVDMISHALGQYRCFLLQGVTGSGKTEVYLQVIAKVLERGQQVLILVPEIGLTPQLLARFTARFNVPMAVMHSQLNETQRQIAWQLAKEKRVDIVIGTRSCVFTPMPDLGLIVIDEEHDASLKQMEGVRYSARDTALMRAHAANIPIILGSATPSLESLYNCTQHKYSLLRLTHKALTTTPLHYQLIDLRAQTLKHGLAEPTIKAISEHLDAQNQVLVFINRRGFAPVLLCHQCGWKAGCKACDTHLTLHKQLKQMICHHCGLTQGVPTFCFSCRGKELIPVGSGTQRIFEFLHTQFPKVAIARIDRDEVRKKDALDTHLDKISSGETQLIVGTQMLAKGHHFPRLSLVVVLDADAGLYNQDFRAVEQLGQLITQVAGRAGRAEYPGSVVIQTHLPTHPLLNLLIREGYDAFAEELLTTRKLAKLPPYHYMAVIRAQGKGEAQVFKFLQRIKEHIKQQPIQAMGPAPAPLARKANQYRMQLLVKSPSRTLLNQALTQVRSGLMSTPIMHGIRWNVDVDPMDLS